MRACIVAVNRKTAETVIPGIVILEIVVNMFFNEISEGGSGADRSDNGDYRRDYPTVMNRRKI